MSETNDFVINFWNKVYVLEHENGCWLWKAGTDTDGYGQYRKQIAHRVAYELAYGTLNSGTVLYHACRNRRCVNPDHLLYGTPHKPVVEKRAYVPLTWDDVLLIRALRKNKSVTNRELAAQFGVSATTISNIANYRTWKLAA